MPSTLTDVPDLTRPEFWQADPYPTLHWLRANAPVFWHELPDRPPFWAITRYDDIVSISKNPEVFSSARGLVMSESTDPVYMAPSMVRMDDPLHKWMRSLVSKGFTPPRIRELEGYIRSLTTDILDSVSDRGEVEFVTEVAALLPVYVIGEMLGVPREDQHLIKEWSDATAEVSDDGELTERGKTAFVEMMQYLAAMQDARIKTPTDDLVSLLLTAEVDGRKLTIDEQQGFFQLLEFAGNETTRNSIAGGVHALGAEHPEEKDRLIEDPSLVPSAVEEILRYVTPVTHFKRTVMSDTEVRGEALSEGEELILFYSAGNRDPEVFPNPDAFDIGRRPNPQIALGGGGPHFCLGASLGRLEMRVMFEELIRRFPDFEVVGPIERPMSNFIRGIQSMPVKLGSDHG